MKKKEREAYQSLYPCSIREAVKQMDRNGKGFVTVVDAKERVMGVLTDGDFRRAVLKGISLDDDVVRILNTQFYYLEQDYTLTEVESLFLHAPIKQIPILDKGKLVDILFREAYYVKLQSLQPTVQLNLPVVIMAGGEGKRLEPLTKIFPKALLPIENRPILDYIIDEYERYGIQEFYVSLNYKSSLIKVYLEDRFGEGKGRVHFVEEKKPLGTAGGLSLLAGRVEGDFFVSNCDILIKADYRSIAEYHSREGNLLTIVGSTKHFTVPYGVCDIDEEGTLLRFQEKPHFDFLVNTGMYVLSSKLLSRIPKETYTDMTDLVMNLLKGKEKVGIYPVSERAWIDIGEWEKFREASELISEKLRVR